MEWILKWLEWYLKWLAWENLKKRMVDKIKMLDEETIVVFRVLIKNKSNKNNSSLNNLKINS